MFFPFMRYVSQSFNFDAGTSTLYTIPSTMDKAMVVVEMTSMDVQTNESVTIYVEASGGVTENQEIMTCIGTTFGGDGKAKYGAVVCRAGDVIKGTSVNENNVQGKLHVFGLPSDP